MEHFCLISFVTWTKIVSTMSGLAKSVIPLLSEWENYTHENPEGDIRGFATWILAQHVPLQPPPPTNINSTDLNDTSQGALLIARLHRILRVLSKPIIKNLGFTKDMEFAVLVHVAIMDKPNKKELCRELLIENSTGVEITKRLAKKGLIAETPDPGDRRSALLSITDKGKKILLQGYDRLAAVHTSFLDALGIDEKRQLVTLLTRINQHHSEQINNRPDFLE
jgi:DNA-binding MarR family transcriptional regulator